MPKRSNDFQQLVYQIYKHLAPVDASVTESAMVQRRNSHRKREVDILIEYELAGHKFNMAIECRDRSRKDDETWIDDIIGKYIDLPIDKKIVVSRLGFTEGAKEKALQHGIETLSLEEATQIDWENRFTKIGLSIFTRKQYLRMVIPETDPPLDIDSEPNLQDCALIDADGEEVGNLDDFAKEVYETKISLAVDLYMQQNFLNIFKVKSDLDSFVFIEYSWVLPLSAFVIIYNTKRHLLRLNFKVICAVLAVDQKLEHISFNNQAIISSWTQENGQKINIIQKADNNAHL